VISVRDVTFDKSQRFSGSEEEPLVAESIIKAVEVASIDDDDLQDYSVLPRQSAIGVHPDFKRSIDAPGDTVIVDDHLNTQLPTPGQTPTPEPKAATPGQTRTPTPEPGPATPGQTRTLTPEPEVQTESPRQSDVQEAVPSAAEPTEAEPSAFGHSYQEVMSDTLVPSQRIVGDISEENVVEGKRERRQQSYATAITHLHQHSTYHHAFTATTAFHPSSKQARFHQSELPPPPSN
jgi:hypothetical protein